MFIQVRSWTSLKHVPSLSFAFPISQLYLLFPIGKQSWFQQSHVFWACLWKYSFSQATINSGWQQFESLTHIAPAKSSKNVIWQGCLLPQDMFCERRPDMLWNFAKENYVDFCGNFVNAGLHILGFYTITLMHKLISRLCKGFSTHATKAIFGRNLYANVYLVANFMTFMLI